MSRSSSENVGFNLSSHKLVDLKNLWKESSTPSILSFQSLLASQKFQSNLRPLQCAMWNQITEVIVVETSTVLDGPHSRDTAYSATYQHDHRSGYNSCYNRIKPLIVPKQIVQSTFYFIVKHKRFSFSIAMNNEGDIFTNVHLLSNAMVSNSQASKNLVSVSF